MSAARDLFVEEARGVSVEEAMTILPLGPLVRISATGEYAGPCPACGGTDRFAVNPARGRWLCRGSIGGRDALSLAGHVHGLDLKSQDGFLRACSALLGRDPPDGSEESDADRREREARLRSRREANERAQAERDSAAFDHREAERARARGKWQHAEREGDHLLYLARRLDCWRRELPVAPFLRTIRSETYWHGRDARGHAAELHSGPAMVAPFVDADGVVVGCHLTWIDFDCSPKFRPRISDPQNPRERPLPSKKMRGSKKGGLIPLIGFYQVGPLILPDVSRRRVVTGEGIENVLAVALAEGPRADTLYCAAGDLGNLAGPADPASRFTHPDLKKADRRGVMRSVFVQGPVPKPDQAPDDAMPFPAHAAEVLLLGDSDSEIYATAAAMGRAKRRAEGMGALADIAWPPRGMDFADLVSAAPSRN